MSRTFNNLETTRVEPTLALTNDICHNAAHLKRVIAQDGLMHYQATVLLSRAGSAKYTKKRIFQELP